VGGTTSERAAVIYDQLFTRADACRNRTDLIVLVVDFFEHASYLEIGCRKNETFDAVKCARKVGVDMIEGGTHRMTSDAFFAQNTDKFDAVFIDGDHRHAQAMSDAVNALACLAPGGTLILHDCSPPTAQHESLLNVKCGSAWRVFAELRQRGDLDMVTADWDFGSGLIRVGANPDTITTGKSMDDMTYADFIEHRDDWMKLRDRQGIGEWLWEQKHWLWSGV